MGSRVAFAPSLLIAQGPALWTRAFLNRGPGFSGPCRGPNPTYQAYSGPELRYQCWLKISCRLPRHLDPTITPTNLEEDVDN